MPNYVAVYSDDREPNWRRIHPAASFGHAGETITFANYMDVDVELHFKDWPFDSSPEDPAILAQKSTRDFTLAGSFPPFKVFPFRVKVAKTIDEAEGSRPILIIYP
ncbi:MAG: hypothetical protein PVH24_02810 [Candidatus Zixiibacteriota bacterium]|jgi:hypothetical protein